MIKLWAAFPYGPSSSNSKEDKIHAKNDPINRVADSPLDCQTFLINTST